MIPGTDLPIAPEPSHNIPDIAAPSDERQGFGPKRMRMELPMIVQNMVLNSRPDSGSEENIIVADPVSELNLDIDTSPEHQKRVRIANGKVVKALGRILVACAFAKEPTVQVTCFFAWRCPREDEEESPTPKRIKTPAKRGASRWLNSKGERGVSGTQESSEHSHDKHDAREIYRRELAKQAILKRPQAVRAAAWLDEQNTIDVYKEKKAGKAQVSASLIVEPGASSAYPIGSSPAESGVPD